MATAAAAALVFRLHSQGPELVREVLLERGWEEYDSEDHEDQDWNLYWRGSTFSSLEYRNLLPWQRLNHHPKTVGITRKVTSVEPQKESPMWTSEPPDCEDQVQPVDFLVRNLRRMRATCGSSLYDFSPTAFILPKDYTRFLAEHKNLHLSRGRSALWICKPVDLSRGRGIFIFQDLKDLVYDGPVILQRYISDPLLVSGYKFDLRIYVCVKSFHPLTVYIHQEGLVRFATEKYDLSSLQNLYAHLTNTSINKLGPFYTAHKDRVGPGCKWTMNRFRHFLQGQGVNELLLWQRINNIVTLTLLTIAPSVPRCPNCVELFGFDVLIDSEFKAWLLEVNYSPALTLDCQADMVVKKALVGDLIDLMNYSASDSLRQRAYRNRQNRRPGPPVPLLSKYQGTKCEKVTGSDQHLGPGPLPRPRLLPPVDLYRIHADKVLTSSTSRTHPDKTLNLILGPVNRPSGGAGLAPWPRGNRRLHHDTGAQLKISADTVASSRTPDLPQRRGLGFRTSHLTWKLPTVNSSLETKEPSDRTRVPREQHVPPVRVGGFIRTFPFNRATRKASQHQLDVKKVLQELQKLTNQLLLGQREKTSGRRTEEELREKPEEGEKFESLFWGLKDPLLISQCLRHQEN